ncbi:85/88 kDa calcium-independent phospholipase A2-like [Gouania willdenowi]|uniref:85/88 kDa calcium-independent phospholipase A2-like n=1 Tax=Gouania willdenowi TaxID=441366 RepID=UPI0010555B7B|nr:85/88 kDa calcium-independent phospholipase A2-like [Gouania willdenowi]
MALQGVMMQNLLDTVSNNPYRVRDVPLSDYEGGGKVKVREENRVVLYKKSQCQSWDCLLMCPNTPTMTLRLFQVVSEDDAMNWFSEYPLKLQPFYDTLPLKAESIQPIVNCSRSHPDWSCAHIAVKTGLRKFLKYTAFQSHINSQNEVGQTPLHLACERGDLASVKQLLDESQARTDIRDCHGDTPMHCACKHESSAFVEALCSRLCTGVDDLNDNGETPLHVACRLGRVESVKALLGGGAKCDVIGGLGYPIHIGMKYNEKDCVEEILRADSSQLQAEDALYGGTPLHWAKTAEMCRLLLEHDCSVNYLNKTGESALHILTKRGRFEAAMVLLTHGADANLKGQDGNTALHLAMKMDHMDLIKALIVFGADVEIPNNLGETPGLIAARTSKGPNREILLDMLFSVGVQRFLPASPGSPPPMSSTTKPQGIGFEALTHVEAPGASAGTTGPGRFQVDGQTKMDRLLCLDGGGIKGLVLIQMLIALEKEAGRPTRELFDWVAGTSTGGILALAIIHGKSLEYLRCLYFRMKEQVFKGSRPYETTPLEKFLKKEFGEDTKMTDVQYPRVMVTSVLADRHPGELHIFRNYDPPSVASEPPYSTSATFRPLTIPQDQLVWRAARSSGAAPTYFQPMGRFLDGGLLANNPTLDAMAEIHQYNKTLTAEGKDTKKLGMVLSLGTGKPPQVEVSSVNVFRPSNPLELAKSLVGAKELLKMLVDCCTDSDGCAVDRARAFCEMTDTLYQRLSPQLSQEVMLDEVSDSVLVDMLWETQMYLYEQRTVLQSVAQSLLDT